MGAVARALSALVTKSDLRGLSSGSSRPAMTGPGSDTYEKRKDKVQDVSPDSMVCPHLTPLTALSAILCLQSTLDQGHACVNY